MKKEQQEGLQKKEKPDEHLVGSPRASDYDSGPTPVEKKEDSEPQSVTDEEGGPPKNDDKAVLLYDPILEIESLDLAMMFRDLKEPGEDAAAINKELLTHDDYSILAAFSTYCRDLELLRLAIEKFFKLKPDAELDKIDDQLIENTVNTINEKYYPIFRAAGLSDQDAQSDVFDVVMKFLKACKNLVIRKTAPGYINSIVRNKIYSFYRAKYKERERREWLEEREGKPTPASGVCSHLDSETQILFADILMILTPRQQEIVQLLIEGYTQQEISQELDVKPSTVSYHVKKLKELLVLELALRGPNRLN